MNLTQIVSYIGQNDNALNDNPFKSIIKDDIKSIKEDEQYYVVSMVFDLDSDFIDFEMVSKFSNESKYKYYYFGNNQASSTQFYLTRQASSLKYLFGSVFSDLYLMLQKENMTECKLAIILKSMQEKGFIEIKDKKGKGSVNLNKLRIIKEQGASKFELGEKEITLNDKKYNFESFIKYTIGDDNKKNKIALIVPAVRENGYTEILCFLDDYLEIVKRVNNLGKNCADDEDSSEGKICYICGRRKKDVKSDYSTKFARKCINKIFTTEASKHTSRIYKNFDYDDVYSMCRDCFNNLLNGEKIVTRKLHSKIAGEDVYVIPEGIIGSFDYNYMYDLKEKVDMAFNASEAENLITSVESSAYFESVRSYSLNFIFFRTDGRSFNVLETIEDVPTLRFDKVIRTLSKSAEMLNGLLDHFYLGDVYRIVPVRQNNKREQIDIGRVLSLYKSILQGEKVDANVLFSYASEAYEKGLNQLKSNEIKNYYNMDLFSFKKYPNYDDLFIKKITMSYLVLLRCCQEMNILNKKIFNSGEEGDNMDAFITQSEKINSFISDAESFLDKQGFSRQAKALFYLGVLINKVAIAQVKKEHETKPILKKIQFQGMKESEVYRLYNEIVEKLRQYEILTPFNEALMNRFHNYYGSIDQEWTLSEQANVFYIMAGYSYMVGRKAADPSYENQNQID